MIALPGSLYLAALAKRLKTISRTAVVPPAANQVSPLTSTVSVVPPAAVTIALPGSQSHCGHECWNQAPISPVATRARSHEPDPRIRIDAEATQVAAQAEENLRPLAGELARGEAGKLAIGAGVTTCVQHLPPWLREFRARHPGIVEIFDADVQERLPWIAMEYLDGGDLVVLGDADAHPEGRPRLLAALRNPNAGEVVVSAAPGWEFRDLAGRHHAGGGSHGSLSAGDSEVPMLTVGVEGEAERISSVAGLVLGHLGVAVAVPA